MKNIISIKSRAQLNLPKNSLNKVRPHADFWSLAGSLKSEKRLSDAELREARKAFSRSAMSSR
jgi:hypothetical protein